VISACFFVFTNILSIKQFVSPDYTAYHPEYDFLKNQSTSTVMAFVSTTEKDNLKYKFNDGVNYVLVLKSEVDKKQYEGSVVDWDKLSAKNKQELLKEYNILVERFDQTPLATLKLEVYKDYDEDKELRPKKVLLREMENGLWESIAEFNGGDYVSVFVFDDKLYFGSDNDLKLYSYDLKTKEKKLFFEPDYSQSVGGAGNYVHTMSIKTIDNDVYLHFGNGIFWAKSTDFSSGKFSYLTTGSGARISQDDNGRYWIRSGWGDGGSWGGYIQSFDPITKKIGRKLEFIDGSYGGESPLGKTKNGDYIMMICEASPEHYTDHTLPDSYILKDLYIFNYDKWTSSTILAKGVEYPKFREAFYNPNYNEVVFVAEDGVYRYNWLEKQIKKINTNTDSKGFYRIVDGNLKFCDDKKGGFVLNFKDNSATYFDQKDNSCCEGCRDTTLEDNGMLDDARNLPKNFKVITLE